MRYKIFIIVILCCCCTYLSGQDIIKPNIYSKSVNLYNPASEVVREDRYKNLDIYGRYKFVDNDIWRKDMNLILNYTGRSENLKGFYMLSYLYDNYSYYNRHTLSAGYGTGWSLSENSSINIGVRGVFNIDDVKWSGLYNSVEDISRNHNKYITPDIDIGLEYEFKKLRLGLSVKNLAGIERKVQRDGITLINRRLLFFDAAYKFSLSEKLEMESHLSTYFERSITADIGSTLTYGKRYNLLYNFRLLELRHTAGILIDDIIKGVSFGVVYDISHIHIDHNLDLVFGIKF